ncbi:WD repeat-containing protein 62 isoform X1 [Erpetoichthys calabaricus]|nr:WD repeat-containing protein 62 isoform X1 [Erpetoichthys calabaricus]
MAEWGLDGQHNGTFTSRIKKLLHSPPALRLARRSRQHQQQQAKSLHNRVTLEKVLGVTASSSSGLACDPTSGLVAYPAGCVVVLLNPKNSKQSHILNSSRKTFTALAFSQDGKYLVTGESGHMPAVRIWDVTEKTQVAEVQCHKYGVSCVAFSANSTYVVSVGYEHDMTVNVWEWKKGIVIASNKVSSKVTAVSFSEDNSYFVTVGNRHVKFWYLDASKERRVNGTVPLIGRSGLLGEQRNKLFCGVACGKGRMASNTFCITSSGLLCQFNKKRLLDSWIDLKSPVSNCVVASEDYVFCGCADGTLRIFNPQNLHYITSLPKPHHLGVDIALGADPGHLFDQIPGAVYPDAVALAFDPVTKWLSCVYSDHSLYVWDVKDMKKVGKVNSALYHSACVWCVETYPELEDSTKACLPSCSFLTCSSDNTIRLWNMEDHSSYGPLAAKYRNYYSHDLLKVVYVGNNTQHLQDSVEKTECGMSGDIKSGIRVLAVSPSGQHLASGDRSGNLRIYDLQFLDEIIKVEAHDSEVLCLEYSGPDTGMSLLASASRDRLIHALNVEKNYSLEQTLDDHSSSITAVKFAGGDNRVRMISCGADKSIYFRTAEKSADGVNFSRMHHVVGKTTLYDMDVDATRKYAAIGCQDRNIRIYNIASGKQKKCFKGSQGEDGTLLKVKIDPSGMFLATSCSDKNISIFDFYSGECVATVFGHSEIVTGMRFTNDCRRLITVSGDSCVFIWRLDSQMTNCMRKRLLELKLCKGQQKVTPSQNEQIRRETYITVPHKPEIDAEEEASNEDLEEDEFIQTPTRDGPDQSFMDPTFLQTNGRLPLWAKRLGAAENFSDELQDTRPGNRYQPRGRWAESTNQEQIKAILDTRCLQMCLTPSPPRGIEGSEALEEDSIQPQSLESLLVQEDEIMADELGSRMSEPFERPSFLQLQDVEEIFNQDLDSPETSDEILYPTNSTIASLPGESEFDVKELHKGTSHKIKKWRHKQNEEHSPDSACCVGSAGSCTSNLEMQHDDVDSLSQLSSAGSSSVDEEEEEHCGSITQDMPMVLTPEQEKVLLRHFATLADDLENEKFDNNLMDLQPSTESFFLNPRLSISARFLSRCQNVQRLASGFPPKILISTSELPVEENSRISIKEEEVSLKRVSTGASCESLAEKDLKPKVRRRSSSFNTGRPPRPKPTPVASSNPHRDEASATGTQGSTATAQDPNSATRRQSLNTQNKESHPAKSSRQSYMGTTASSRAKMSRSVSMGENLNARSAEEQFKNGLNSKGRASSTLDLCVRPEVVSGKEHDSKKYPASSQDCEPLVATVQGNHQARAGLHLDLCMSSSDQAVMSSPPIVGIAKARPKRYSDISKPSLSLATPTEMRSLGKEGKSYITSVLETICASPASPATRGVTCSTASPSVREVTYSIAIPAAKDVICSTACATTREVAGIEPSPIREGICSPLPRLSTTEPKEEQIPLSEEHKPTASATLVSSCDKSESDKPDVLCNKGPDKMAHSVADPPEVVSLQSCRQIANELHNTLQRAVSLYGKVSSVSESPEQELQMKAILTDAFLAARRELDVVDKGKAFPVCTRPHAEEASPSPTRQLKDDRTIALLERYSEMLLKITEKKMEYN